MQATVYLQQETKQTYNFKTNPFAIITSHAGLATILLEKLQKKKKKSRKYVWILFTLKLVFVTYCDSINEINKAGQWTTWMKQKPGPEFQISRLLDKT